MPYGCIVGQPESKAISARVRTVIVITRTWSVVLRLIESQAIHPARRCYTEIVSKDIFKLLLVTLTNTALGVVVQCSSRQHCSVRIGCCKKNYIFAISNQLNSTCISAWTTALADKVRFWQVLFSLIYTFYTFTQASYLLKILFLPASWSSI